MFHLWRFEPYTCIIEGFSTLKILLIINNSNTITVCCCYYYYWFVQSSVHSFFRCDICSTFHSFIHSSSSPVYAFSHSRVHFRICSRTLCEYEYSWVDFCGTPYKLSFIPIRSFTFCCYICLYIEESRFSFTLLSHPRKLNFLKRVSLNRPYIPFRSTRLFHWLICGHAHLLTRTFLDLSGFVF